MIAATLKQMTLFRQSREDNLVKKQVLGEILVNAGFISQAQAEECIAMQESTGRRLGEILVEKGYITEKKLMQILEVQLKVPYVDLDHQEIYPDVARYVPVELARRNTLAPVTVKQNVLYIAIDDPKNFRAIDEVRRTAHMEVQAMLASEHSILSYIDRIYGNEFAQKALNDFQKEIGYEEAVTAALEEISEDVSSAPVVRLVNAIIEQAVTIGASDVHIEPLPQHVRVRMRVDGALYTVLTMPLGTANAMIARVKILGNLNIAEHMAPQDGRFNMNVLKHEIDIRLSVIPTIHGEKAVLRLLDRSSFLIPKAQLGFTEANLAKFDDLLATPHGIILVTGPTGSGKSTTLYTMLDEINNVGDNIVTVEDPVEYMIDGLSQIQVNPKAGVTFASGLRSILRQDPDIIMIGEIRDAETVEIAIRAAITGHLVLSTIHTNDSVSTVYRLVDMGIPPYMVAASLIGIIAQRLIRLICPNCREAYTPSKSELELADMNQEERQVKEFYRGRGCNLCNRTGYKGRIAVHEILTVDNTFRDLVHKNAALNELRRYAVSIGMETLRESTFKVFKEGRTTLEEIISVTHGT